MNNHFLLNMLNWKTSPTLLLLSLGTVSLLCATEQPLLNLPGSGDPPLIAQAGNDGPSPLLFDTAPPNPVAQTAPAAPSPNATINLIRILVKKKVLTEAEAAEMIQQAEDEAAVAQAQAAGVSSADSDGAVRVTYVPEIVKDQIRNELKADVMSQAKREGWAAPKEVPDWTKRIKLFGDVRLRYESNYFP
ncbi:MAG: putative porin, partial [Verrucomicrobia bacterium]|nr:putative porin [Verrucomicrobiota bacterium]